MIVKSMKCTFGSDFARLIYHLFLTRFIIASTTKKLYAYILVGVMYFTYQLFTR